MNILILHRIPYHYVRYAESIDHSKHNVYYVGVEKALANIPDDISCSKIMRKSERSVAEEVLKAIESLEVEFDLVISLSEYELMEAAKVRESLNIDGPKPAQVLKVRDKVVMKKSIVDNGISAPSFMSLTDWLHQEKPIFRSTADIILKPVDGASSENVQRYQSEESLRQTLLSKNTGIDILDREIPNYQGFQVEEFVDGPICHFDGIVDQGEIKALTGAQYINSLLDYAQIGTPVASVQIELTQSLKDWVAKVIQAVEIQQGAFHLEAIMHQGEPVFLEIANRAGGARVIETFQKQTGIHIPSAELKFMLGESQGIQPCYDDSNKYSWLIVPGHHFSFDYCNVSGLDFLKDDNMVVAQDIISPETKLPDHISYLEGSIPFAALLKAANTSDLEQKVTQVFGQIQITPRPLNSQ